MLTCDHCGARFVDEFIEQMRASLPDGMPMSRHGEDGFLLHGPVLCETCRQLPPETLAAISKAFFEARLKQH
jgi:uncharacterized radical SAM superfamily protein